MDCRALVPRARNDVFSPRHCEGVRRTTEAIQSAGVACFYGLPRGALSGGKNLSPELRLVEEKRITRLIHSVIIPFHRNIRVRQLVLLRV